MASSYKIDDTLVGLTSLDALGIIADPRSDFQPFADTIIDGAGGVHGIGFPVVEWHWDVMRTGEADILAAFLAGAASANVFIQTKTNRLSTGDAYTFKKYSAVMVWPTSEDIQSKRALGLTIRFTQLVEQP